jgi:hypothetical protein
MNPCPGHRNRFSELFSTADSTRWRRKHDRTGENKNEQTPTAERRSQLGYRRICNDEIFAEKHTTQKQLTQKSPTSNVHSGEITTFPCQTRIIMEAT